jgi:predicted O-linked N-acetylglucosamine transferase (SPINDLY family)
MANGRLHLFSRRVAPVQVNYLAYPFTGGLRAMDYRLTDATLDPIGGRRYGPERLIRLGHSFWVYRGDPDAPEPAANLPAENAGVFTFANLNDPRKLNTNVAQAWAQIMRQVPNSKLLLSVHQAAGQRRYVHEMFAAAGVEPVRIDLIEAAPRAEHLVRYRSADLSLDPFPYGGHTTALDSIWMGVPVLTLAGDAPYTRGAASILPRIGLGELVTTSIDEYVSAAIQLARDLARLKILRRDLRQRMQASALCDEGGFVSEYEAGLRQAWRRHCHALPPDDIDSSAA